jgi:hypothetical protein
MLGLTAIYIILAWVFASYSRPFVVMAIIPFGLIGAVLGHLALGYDLTILSMVALLGLSGILVNDSIILVASIDRHLADGEHVRGSIVDGTCERLRAVILTSLTTIGGLTPLLFETSLQAQFLIPMAITLVFGLMVTTFLVLLVVPSLLAIQEDAIAGARWVRRRMVGAGAGAMLLHRTGQERTWRQSAVSALRLSTSGRRPVARTFSGPTVRGSWAPAPSWSLPEGCSPQCVWRIHRLIRSTATSGASGSGRRSCFTRTKSGRRPSGTWKITSIRSLLTGSVRITAPGSVSGPYVWPTRWTQPAGGISLAWPGR